MKAEDGAESKGHGCGLLGVESLTYLRWAIFVTGQAFRTASRAFNCLWLVGVEVSYVTTALSSQICGGVGVKITVNQFGGQSEKSRLK